MNEQIQKLNDLLGYLTALCFDKPDLTESLEKPLNDLSEVISEFENLVIADVSDCDHWTCEKCGKVPNEQVTYEETHDGCGGHCS